MDRKAEIAKAFNAITKKYNKIKITPDMVETMITEFIAVLKCYYDVNDKLISIVLDADCFDVYFKPGNQYTLDLLSDIVQTKRY
jgi:hypothetical protein